MKRFLFDSAVKAFCILSVLLSVSAMPLAAQTEAPAPVPGSVVQDGATYLQQAREVTADTHQRFWMPETKRYSGQAGSKQADAVWGAGVMYSALVGAARHEPGTYRGLLDEFFDGLEGYWDKLSKDRAYEPTPRQNGNDKYYDDNAWMVITFYEAYELTDDLKFKRRAEETLEFVLSGWDDSTLGGGIWWHEAREKKDPRKNTCANGPSAVGCLLSAKHHPGPRAEERIAWARKIVEWTVNKLQLEDGLFADSIALDGTMNRDKLTYNSALMLRAFLGLHRVSKDPTDLAAAQRIGRAGEWFVGEDTGAFRDAVKWSHLMVEADLELYRTTNEPYLLERAAKNARYYYERWNRERPRDLIDAASIARILWLMADATTNTGKKFWERSDALGAK
jgi:hypothetical protein